jgi:glucose-6-phosphate isomerase
VRLSLANDHPKGRSDELFARFQTERVLERLRTLDERVRREGLAGLHADQDLLIRIGMETDSAGRVTKNGYGVFNLSWQVPEHPEWPDMIAAEVNELRAAIQSAHRVRLRYLLWCGMGGSAEDKSMYLATGLLRRGVRCYVLDSTDPAKLKWILEDIRRRDARSLPEILKSSLVVGMAMGMTSYEPVVNLEKLTTLYEKHRIPSQANFLYMTLPGSVLDRFAQPRGYRRVELQPDNANTTAGRHSGPLTRGSLYPLALAGVDLRAWMTGAVLDEEQIHTAWRLASFIHAQGEAGRDKLTLLLPRCWKGAGIWTKQDFEESLGKSEQLGLKVVVDEKPKLADYRSPKDPRQDRAFLAVQVQGEHHPEAAKIARLKAAGYPTAVLSFDRGALLSTYMQFIHYTVFGVAYLREMNFVTQPSVELYKAVAAEIYREAQEAGGIRRTAAWRQMMETPRRVRFGPVTLCYHLLDTSGAEPEGQAPERYAWLLEREAAAGRISYGELTFFGDTRYWPEGKAVLRLLKQAAGELFRSALKMPADVYEGPAMNHSYHEMIIGHGRCFSTVLATLRPEELPAAGYTADYHMAQFLATQIALARRGRAVVAILLDQLEPDSLLALREFFHRAALAVKAAMRKGAVAGVI